MHGGIACLYYAWGIACLASLAYDYSASACWDSLSTPVCWDSMSSLLTCDWFVTDGCFNPIGVSSIIAYHIPPTVLG